MNESKRHTAVLIFASASVLLLSIKLSCESDDIKPIEYGGVKIFVDTNSCPGMHDASVEYILASPPDGYELVQPDASRSESIINGGILMIWEKLMPHTVHISDSLPVGIYTVYVRGQGRYKNCDYAIGKEIPVKAGYYSLLRAKPMSEEEPGESPAITRILWEEKYELIE